MADRCRYSAAGIKVLNPSYKTKRRAGEIVETNPHGLVLVRWPGRRTLSWYSAAWIEIIDDDPDLLQERTRPVDDMRNRVMPYA